MNVEELKQAIERRTGVPVFVLTGETAEENIAQAKAIIAYKREHEAQQPKTTSDKFAEWFRQLQGIEETGAAGEALAQIEAAAGLDAGGYPTVTDGGGVNVKTGDGRPASEQFAEWFSDKFAYDPASNHDGWKL